MQLIVNPTLIIEANDTNRHDFPPLGTDIYSGSQPIYPYTFTSARYK